MMLARNSLRYGPLTVVWDCGGSVSPEMSMNPSDSSSVSSVRGRAQSEVNSSSAETEFLVLLSLALFGVVVFLLAAIEFPDIVRSAEDLQLLSWADVSAAV
jgi:hypothetical protein